MNPTKEQQAVIECREGRLLVNSDPATGKTATISKRAQKLPASDTALIVAFNRAAAEEFAGRIGARQGVDCRTLHSFALRQIMSDPGSFGFKRRPRVVNNGIFSGLCEATQDDYQGWDDSPWDSELVRELEHGVYTGELDGVVDELPEGVTEAARVQCAATVQAVKAYRKMLDKREIVTFDSMVRLVAERGRERLRAEYVAEHVMVDEYQDVDRFQYDTVQAMADNAQVQSVCCVGDPKQSIYVWRGALADSFERFANYNAVALKEFRLTLNFRSKDEIIALADKVFQTGMRGVRGSDPECVVSMPEYEGPHPFKATNGDLADCAVLCRYNREVLAWQLRLARAGVPVYVLGRGEFWNMRHVKIAMEHRGRGWAAVVEDWRWQKMMDGKRFQGEEGKKQREEVESDARWINGLSDEELETLRSCLQNDEGIRVSTIHKTKGMEFSEVLVHNATDKLQEEREVFFVACTRAKDRLILA